MHFRGTCCVQCFRRAYHNLSLTPRTPRLLRPLCSPTTPLSNVLTAVSSLTMHLQYVSSYHNVRGAHCVSWHPRPRHNGTAPQRDSFGKGALLRPLTPHRGIHFCTTQTTVGCLSVTHLPKTYSALFGTWRFVALFKTAGNWIVCLSTVILLLMLALQPTMGFSLLGDFLPFRPFLAQFSPPTYSHRLDIFLNVFNPSFPWSSSDSPTHWLPF